MTPEEKDLFEKLLSEKISSLHSEIASTKDVLSTKIDNLKEVVLKQNSRIGKLEDFKEYGQHVIDTRTVNCPNLKVMEECQEDIKNIKKEVEDVTFFARHPKIFLGTIIVLVILTLATLTESSISDFLQKRKSNTEQVENNK